MNTRVCLLSHLASHHLRHAFVKVPTRHFLRLTPHVVVYDAHVRTVGDALVRLEALVGEISEQARLARTPLPDEHQLRPCDSLRSAENRLVVRLHKCAPASCLLSQHVGTLFCGCTALAEHHFPVGTIQLCTITLALRTRRFIMLIRIGDVGHFLF